jgi:hypothetical protein
VLVEREQEPDAVERLLAAARDGSGRTLLIEGPPGISREATGGNPFVLRSCSTSWRGVGSHRPASTPPRPARTADRVALHLLWKLPAGDLATLDTLRLAAAEPREDDRPR